MAGVYLHIPLCHSKCAYCDFYSTAASKISGGDICDAMALEYSMRRDEISAPVNTVYVGGGTPSVIAPEVLARALAPVDIGNVSEMTLEVNPEDVSSGNVRAWRALGFNRVSMGVQSFVDDELIAVGRRHSALTALNAYGLLRADGFDNISLDLIYGLPGQDLKSWQYSLDTLMKLHPEHFSAYCLSYEPGTRLYAMRTAGKITETDDDTLALMYDYLIVTARENGYIHYEIANFSLPDRHSRHNSSYWDSTPYLGLGPGAHSFDGNVRRFNPSSIKKYMQAITSGTTAYEIDIESETDRLNDVIFTALRTARGLRRHDLPHHMSDMVFDNARQLAAMTPGSQHPHYVITDDSITIPERQWLIANTLISPLML